MSMIVNPFRFGFTLGNGVLARYWRVYVLINNSNGLVSAVSCDNLELRATVGGADQTTTSTWGAVDSASSGTSASQAFDGVNASWWISDNDNNTIGTHWIAYDFQSGNAVSVEEIAWAKRSDGFGINESPLVGVVQRSDDGTTWIDDFLFFTATSWGAGAETRTFTKFAEIGGKRFWRILATGLQGGTGFPFSTGEVQFRETSGGANVATGGVPLSNVANGSRPNSAAFDGNSATWFQSASNISGLTSYIGYAFPEAKSINEVTIQCRPDGFGANEAITAGTVQSSENGRTWTDEWDFTTPATWTNNSTEVRTSTRP